MTGSGQARCYAPKSWGHVVAPTNRRRFGFDWEDWGRMDAMEVLEEAQARFGTDPRRTYLTGHSMGGHGTWNLGAHFPDRFAAIAPICGRGELASAKKLTGLPTWVFCGAKDKQQTVQNAKDMAKAITTTSGKAKLTIYPDLAHDCWTVTYDNPEFYTWLLSHKKSP